MKNYKRLTRRKSDGRWAVADDFEAIYLSADRLGNRLCDLEDKIDNGTLVPKYSVVKDCGFYCVCEVDTNNLPVIAQYEIEEEAQKKLEELENVQRTAD